MRHIYILIAFITLFGIGGVAETSQVLSWRDFPQRRGYEPMPVLCVHGIASDSAATWPIAVNMLSNYFSTVYFFQGAGQVLPQRSSQPGAAYVETFDYGVYGDPAIVAMRGHEQTFDSIRSNAWEGVFQSSVNHCITLSNRIDQVREAYIQSGNSEGPPVTLLAHSMGGILSHYYLCRAQEAGVNSGVARLITLGTPHYGSTLPNWQRQVYRSGGWSAVLMRPLKRQSIRLYLQNAAGFLDKDVWNFELYANPPKNQPEKGGMTDMSYHVPFNHAGPAARDVRDVAGTDQAGLGG